jgi:hypothetical protein
MAAASKTRDALIKRLDPYWKMEAGNMAIIPAFVLWVTDARIGWVTLVPLLAMVLLLGIGAVYWWLKVRQLKEQPVDADTVLRRIAALQLPALVLTLAGCGVAALGWIAPWLSMGLADRIAATGCALLAALEYVNYYHRQLQHFDNRTDFRRMLAGKGFRQSWMARDLAELRRRSGS